MAIATLLGVSFHVRKIIAFEQDGSWIEIFGHPDSSYYDETYYCEWDWYGVKHFKNCNITPCTHLYQFSDYTWNLDYIN